MARKHLEFNVAEGIGAALPAARKAKKHHAALPYSEVGAALAAIALSTASDAVKACLRFTVLTAVRSGEARGATWNEMDLQAAERRIEASPPDVAVGYGFRTKSITELRRGGRRRSPGSVTRSA